MIIISVDLIFNNYNMSQVLDKTSKTVLLKLSIQEFKRINESWIFDDEKIEDYEFIFDKSVKASDLLKTF